MPHAHPLYINQVEDHLAEITKSKKRNYESAQAIKNGFLFTLDFLRSTYLDQKSSNPAEPFIYSLCTLLCTFYGLLGAYITYLLLHSTKTFMYHPFLKPIQNLFTIYFPSLYPFHPILLPHQTALKPCHPLHATSCRNNHIIRPLQQPLYTSS